MILTMVSSEQDFFDILGTLKVAQNTTGLQIKAGKCTKSIAWFMDVEAGSVPALEIP